MIEAGLWGLLAASSLVLGATVAVVAPPGRRLLGLVMAFGSGVLLSAISFELVEEAVRTAGALGSTFLGLFVGAIVFTVGDVLICRLGYADRKDISGAPPDAGGLTIVLGSLLDGIPESAVLGLTLLQTGDVAAAMLVAVFVSNVPRRSPRRSGCAPEDGRAPGCSPCGRSSPQPRRSPRPPGSPCSTARRPTPWRSRSPSPAARC
jgi:ZIP family zinc transporter